MAGNLQRLIFTDQSDGEYVRKTDEMCEDFSQYLHQTVRDFYRHPNLDYGYPNIWRVDIFRNIREISSSFLSWLHFMRVGKFRKNFARLFCLLREFAV